MKLIKVCTKNDDDDGMNSYEWLKNHGFSGSGNRYTRRVGNISVLAYISGSDWLAECFAVNGTAGRVLVGYSKTSNVEDAVPRCLKNAKEWLMKTAVQTDMVL